MSHPITLQLYDLTSRAQAGRLRDCVARETEITRLVRLLAKPNHPHVVLLGEPGSGKTSLIEALCYRHARRCFAGLPERIYQLNTSPLIDMLIDGDTISGCVRAMAKLAAELNQGVIILEDLQLLIRDDADRLEIVNRLLEPLVNQPAIRVLVTCTTEHFTRFLAKDYSLNRTFNKLELPPPLPHQAEIMLKAHVPQLEKVYNVTIAPDVLPAFIASRTAHIPGRSLPDTALRLLEEACQKAHHEQKATVSSDDLNSLLSELNAASPTGNQDDDAIILTLEATLSRQVIGQTQAIHSIVGILQRRHLGLTDPSRPHGSFLLLGPSGVGKTETAKALAQALFRHKKAFIRLDMSEFSEAHASVRLIGSPPGYVGYEEGGQLTNPVAQTPSSLILLDEIEKAHPKLFDLFLQLLDDGRLTDAKGQTVDFTQTVVMATSNCAALEISQACGQAVDIHTPEFLHQTILPILMQQFRPEFLNRFDAILIYNPLQREHLVELAQQELRRLEERLAKYGIRFQIPNERLADLLQQSANPLFGARPVKRLIQQQFEAPLARHILHTPNQTVPLITGDESWLST